MNRTIRRDRKGGYVSRRKKGDVSPGLRGELSIRALGPVGDMRCEVMRAEAVEHHNWSYD